MSELKLPELFGSRVFNEETMKERLSGACYQAWKRCVTDGASLELAAANEIAGAMKTWAVERGCTHYTHWFQPMTGFTAEKHDSFIAPAEGGRVILEFSGKNLVRGEADASSFPSGGLRATFEARGYTAWDPSSFAFIKEGTLCIPTILCSYGGHALDKKTPLLRSMEDVSRQAIRILRLFGDTETRKVTPCVGPEQEYFLVDKKMYSQREDLRMTGRTLFGAKPPRGQELDDHYYGAIRPRVAAYMKDLDENLWALGIYSKTKHNEAAPAQHEMAPVYTDANTACDHNQLTMEVMKKVAARHGLVCLLHEKPFDGVNGSGKHNNWSLCTDTGVNLLKPGDTPHQNARFLLFLCAVIQAVDDYQDLLRLSVATASNDHRLGANEAPPAVVSIFLGDELTAVLDAIEKDAPYTGTEKIVMKLGAHVLPRFVRDTTDRNRTSPFAFTGNRFEFRMVGSSDSIACCNVMLNTAVAESLRQYADELEKADDFEGALHTLIQRTIRAHKRIVFNGNGYDDAWIEEATKVRGLLNLRTTPDALPYLTAAKNVEMLTRHKVYSGSELKSRCEINLDNYRKTVHIEAKTMLDMARREILPAVTAYADMLALGVNARRAAVGASVGGYEARQIEKLSALSEKIDAAAEELETALDAYHAMSEVQSSAEFIRDSVLPKMTALRAPCDAAEKLIPAKSWPFPTYAELMFGVK